ncbi:hypothetical protein L5515_009527 [Caenorhabditis briggsae]|uniref:SCP domain-containing protein n=1 Tax=Caenorhabditis briggsae TaxID=6238 RepID=A0AAE9JMD0_CAEBR|nr:hypothetical protein L5515_009527 [Caenorhabditis briggsae]
MNFPDKEQAKFIAQINEKRKEIAKHWDIPNMHQLTWSEELSDIAANISKRDLDKFDSFPFYIVTVPLSNNYKEIALEWERDLDMYTSLMNKKIESVTDYMHPLQTHMACVNSTKYGRNNARIVCLFGPENMPGEWKKGDPGSECKRNYNNSDGICTWVTAQTTPNVIILPNGSRNSSPASSEAIPKPSLDPKQTIQPTTQEPDLKSTLPGTKNPENSQKTKLSPETQTLPKELENYVKVDGDDYDEDFPTGEPLLDSGFKNFLQFWITVVFALGFCFLV